MEAGEEDQGAVNQISSGYGFVSKVDFNNITRLHLRTGFTMHDLVGIEAVLKCSPSLEIMSLIRVGNSNRKELQLVPSGGFGFSMPRLREIKMEQFLGMSDEIYFLKLVVSNGIVLERIVLPTAVLVKVDGAFVVQKGNFQFLGQVIS